MKVIILFFPILLLFSCGKQSETSHEVADMSNKIELEYIKSLEIELDKKTLNWSMNSQYVWEEKKQKEFIYILNSKSSTINIFDTNGDIIKKIKLDRDGPN